MLDERTVLAEEHSLGVGGSLQHLWPWLLLLWAAPVLARPSCRLGPWEYLSLQAAICAWAVAWAAARATESTLQVVCSVDAGWGPSAGGCWQCVAREVAAVTDLLMGKGSPD